jgi:hypothetical protein
MLAKLPTVAEGKRVMQSTSFWIEGPATEGGNSMLGTYIVTAAGPFWSRHCYHGVSWVSTGETAVRQANRRDQHPKVQGRGQS